MIKNVQSDRLVLTFDSSGMISSKAAFMP